MTILDKSDWWYDLSTMKGKTILIIDDEQDLRDALRTALEEADFTVKEAADGEAGVAAALEAHPDLILLDVMMPKMSGHGALEALRADPWGKHVPIIMLTALDDARTVAKAVEGGGDDYIIKSNIHLEEVVEKVRQRIVGYHD